MPVQFYDGKVLFVDGQIAMHEDCCCEPSAEPCSDCFVEQPSVVISFLGGGCADSDEFCAIIEGTATWRSNRTTPLSQCCSFWWLESFPDVLWVRWRMVEVLYDPETKKYFAIASLWHEQEGNNWTVWYGGDIEPCPGGAGPEYGNLYAEVEGITCNKETGHLEGDFVLNGLHPPGCQDCVGCSIDVTLGG